MIQMPRKLFGYALAFIVLLISWQLAAAALNTPALPGPYEVISRPELLFNAAMGRHFGLSLFRVIMSLILGTAIGLPLGLMLGRERALDRLSAPLIFITYPIPKIVFLPIFMIVLGLGNVSKIALMTVIVFFQILVTARDAAKAVPEESVLSIKSLSAGKWQIYKHIVFPASLPNVFTALRVSTGTAIAVLFLTESFATEDGLGYLILNAWSGLNYPQMFAAIMALGAMGVLIYELLEFGERKMCPWVDV
jgi:ABC-type nitrate/sulfonate/bicarbonate transport system permease component